MIGPHVAPEDVRRMVAYEEARLRRLDEDPEVVRAREAYVRRLDAYEAARGRLEEASLVLAAETRRVLEPPP